MDTSLIAPDENGIVWLEMKGKASKRVTYGFWGSLVLVPFSIMMIASMGMQNKPILFITVAILVLSLMLAYFFKMMQKNIRLGRDEKRIFVQNMMTKSAYAPFEEAFFTGNRVVVDNVGLMLVDGYGDAFYDEVEYETYIEPILSQMQKITEMQYMMKNLKNGDVKTWIGLIIGVSIVIVAVYFEVYSG